MVKKSYIPNKGDYVILSFDPQSGHEQKGRRPALIISNYKFNENLGLAIACPITTKDRKFPFHVKVDKSSGIQGFIMVEQVKSIDYKSRKVQFAAKCGRVVLSDVLGILDACVYQE